ncbi:efflux RND transporter periplasmic adaptor subunit [Shewanella sp. SG44-6]|nr:efflux RND transporter periplasmic adaptor subunit [Shewanella sp. SG44-6]
MRKPLVLIVGSTFILFIGIVMFVLNSSSKIQDADNKLTAEIMVKSTSKNSQLPPAVSLFNVTEQTFSQYIVLTGTIEPTKVASLASPAEGPILNLVVREGDTVNLGQEILRIGRNHAADSLQSSAAEEVRKQVLNLRRIDTLVKQHTLPEEQLDEAISSLEKAKAALSQAKQALNDYIVTAPWSGVISKVLVSDGHFVIPRSPMVEMYDPDSLVLRFSVVEAQALVLKKGHKIRATFDGLAGKEFELEIIRAYPDLDRKLRTRLFEAALPVNEFIPGMFARISAIQQKHENTLVIPIDALQVQGNDKSVFVVTDNIATRRLVETGLEQDDQIEVLSGLKAGEKIVLTGIERVKNGSAVRVLEQPAKNNSAGVVK